MVKLSSSSTVTTCGSPINLIYPISVGLFISSVKSYNVILPFSSNDIAFSISSAINDCKRDTTGKTKYWILFDGPVDTFWIEDMNSVLDDSRRLCLPNSAIIVLNETITMMFEVEDLVHASPATVSRCGMVFMEPGAIGLMPLAKSWLDTKLPNSLMNCPPECDVKKRLLELFEMSLEENVQFVRKKIK